jgi:FkbM family methyltransferase
MHPIKEIYKQLTVIFFPSFFKNRLYRFIKNLDWKNLPDEEAELLLMEFFLPGNGIFFDIGANTGIYTLSAEKYIEPQNIYAFEPIPELHFRLKRMFRNAHINKLALSDSTGIHNFKIPTIGKDEYKSRGKLNTEYIERGETNFRIIKVRTSTLDSYVIENNISNIDFIKIDVEGNELQVIMGGVETLKRIRPVLQIEIEQRHYNRNINEIIEFVNKLGYHCYYLDLSLKALKKVENDPKLLQIETNFKTSLYVNNFIFIPDTKEWEAKIFEINAFIIKA